MRIFKLKILLVGLFLASGTLQASDRDCLKESMMPQEVRDGFSVYEGAPQHLRAAVFNYCSDVSPELEDGYKLHTADNLLFEVGNWIYAYPLAFTNGTAWSAFSKLQNSEAQRYYKARLDEIRKIPNRFLRLFNVYQLAIKFQGSYDNQAFESHNIWVRIKDNRIWTTPESAIDMAQKTGSAGICRNFAALLSWSLLQVARPEDEREMGLTENSFLPRMVTSMGSRHAWVEVNLPYKDPSGPGYIFRKLNLDPTFYDRFTPLLPRKNNIPRATLERLNADCYKTLRCLKQSAK